MDRSTIRKYFENIASRLSHIQHSSGSKKTQAFFACTDIQLLEIIQEAKRGNYYMWLEPMVIAPTFQDADQVQNLWSCGFTIFTDFNSENHSWQQYEQRESLCQDIAEQVVVRIRRDTEILTRGIYNLTPDEETEEYQEAIKWLRFLDISSIEYAPIDPTLLDNNCGIRCEFQLKAKTQFHLRSEFWQDA